MPGRTPAMTAMTAATIDNISNGRMLLGIGSSGPQVAEGWHGQPFAKQLQRTREYVEILRMALARDRVEFDGEIYTLPIPDGPGKALKLTIAPVQERIPIYIAAIGPKNTALTGEIADGWIPTFFSPENVGEFRELLGDVSDDFDIAPMVNVAIDDDLDRAHDAMRPILALYVGGMGSREKNFYNALVRRYGFDDAAQEVQDLYLDGKKEEAAAALPAELIDRVSLCGPKERVAERLAVYRDAGVGTLMCTPMAYRRGRPDADDPRARRDCRLAGGSSSPRSATRGTRSRRSRSARPSPRRGHRVCLQTWEKWREDVEREGIEFAPAPEYSVWPTGRDLTAYEAAVRAVEESVPLVRSVRSARRGVGHPHRGRRAWWRRRRVGRGPR